MRDQVVFFDLETGGLQSYRNPIMQIAAVAVTDDERMRELGRFEVKIKFDEKDCSPESLKKVKYDPELWARHAVEPLTAFERFVYFLRDHATIPRISKRNSKQYHVAKLRAHNAEFDASFLFAWHRRLMREHPGLFLPVSRRVRCSLKRALDLFDENPQLTPPPDYTLETLCHYFGVPFSKNESHDAMYDTLALVGLYREMMKHRLPAYQEAA